MQKYGSNPFMVNGLRRAVNDLILVVDEESGRLMAAICRDFGQASASVLLAGACIANGSSRKIFNNRVP
jgi:hypothetical protein